MSIKKFSMIVTGESSLEGGNHSYNQVGVLDGLPYSYLWHRLCRLLVFGKWNMLYNKFIKIGNSPKVSRKTID
jgi:hypothetical protein